jgi:uncharacterized protein YdaU (DUF1376 family)
MGSNATKWMPLNIGWYYSHTMFLNTLEHGAYMLLICVYWQIGKLPDDDKMLARATRLSLHRWRKIKPTISSLFEPGWKHPYLDELKAKCEAGYARRVARMKANDARRPAPADWAVIRSRIFLRDNYTCTYCGNRGGELHCDHVVPIARNGTNDDDNLTTACVDCNISKGARLLSEWRK